MSPDWESNLWPFGLCETSLPPTVAHQPGPRIHPLTMILCCLCLKKRNLDAEMLKDVGLCGKWNKTFQIRTSLENSRRMVIIPTAYWIKFTSQFLALPILWHSFLFHFTHSMSTLMGGPLLSSASQNSASSSQPSAGSSSYMKLSGAQPGHCPTPSRLRTIALGIFSSPYT